MGNFYYTSLEGGVVLIKKIVKVATGVWLPETRVFNTSNPLPVRLRVHATTGDLYYLQGNTINRLPAVNGVVSTSSPSVLLVSDALMNSSFAVGTDKIFYASNATQSIFSVYSLITGPVTYIEVLLGTGIKIPVLVGSDIQIDALGNAYYCGGGILIKYNNAPYPNEVGFLANKLNMCSGYTTANGRFAVNAATGVIYMASNSTDPNGANNVYQLHYVGAGVWESLIVSPLKYWMPEIYISTSNIQKQAGAMAFSGNNLFYIPQSNQLSLIQYNNSVNCHAAYLREDESIVFDSDYLPVTTAPNNGLIESQELGFTVYPNPMENAATISYQLPEDARVSLVLRNAFGQTVQSMVAEMQEKGAYSQELKKAQLNSGLYFLTLTVNDKMTVLKVVIN